MASARGFESGRRGLVRERRCLSVRTSAGRVCMERRAQPTNYAPEWVRQRLVKYSPAGNLIRLPVRSVRSINSTVVQILCAHHYALGPAASGLS